MSEFVRGAGLLVYKGSDQKIEYLLLQASYEPFHWTPPKGHVDPGENERQAAIRETFEEAGISSDKLEILENFQHDMFYTANGEPKRVIYWLAHLKNDEDVKLSHEHKDQKWVELEDAIVLAKYPEMEKLLREANEFIQSKK